MPIVYDPKKELQKIAPIAKIKRMLKSNISLKRTALSFVDSFDFINKKSVTKIALKTIDSYQKRVADEQIKSGLDKSAGDDLEKDILRNPKLLIQRIQNELIFQISQSIRENYDGEDYEWLPSDAEEPDPEHQLNYGKIFTVGVGKMPGDRIGCKCGMRILVRENKLNLE